MWWLIPLFLIGFVAVHIFKMMRLYLVLMEHKIGFGKFVLLYLKTTLVNLIIPFKLGELYRIFCISKATKHWQVGVLSILVDRFFDTLALCVILLPVDIYVFGEASVITWVFLVLMAVVVACYLSVLPTYRYLNRYIIKEKSSPRAMTALKALDVMKIWYDFTQNLISGRFALILLFSFGGWFCEISVLQLLGAWLQGHTNGQTPLFGIGDFNSYIQAIFGMGESFILKPYSICSIAVLFVFTLIAFVAVLIKKGSKKKA